MFRLRLILLISLTAAVSACGNSADVNVTSPTVTRCAVTAAVPSTVVPASGGNGTLTINTERECGWSATAEAAWITLSSSRGQGPASITYSVAANPDSAARRAVVAIEQQRVEIAQEAAPCRFTVSPSTLVFPAAGGQAEVSISTSGSCRWAVQNIPAWAAADRGEGSGSATIRFNAVANAGPNRAASVMVAGTEVTLTQAAAAAPGCSYQVSPRTVSVPAGGGQGVVSVTAAAACSWTAAANVSWISITEGSTGSGAGTVRFNAAPNDGPARSASLVVAGAEVTVTQPAAPAPGCSYQVSPRSINVPAEGGQGVVSVATAAACGWTAADTVSWISITEGKSGSGAGTVRFSATANDGPARSASLVVAGAEVTVTQPAAPAAQCSYQVSPGSFSVPSEGGQAVVNVSAAAGCGWSATPNANWISVTDGSTGAGSGTARLSIAPNDGSARTASVVIAGQAVAITQAARQACSYSIKPTFYNAGAGPDDIDIVVTAGDGCPWTVSGEPSWVTVANGRSGTGTGSVRLAIPANPGGPRNATLTIAGRPFELSQAGSCAATLKPTYYNAGRGPDDFTIAVTATPGCEWSANSQVDWATIQSGHTGSGNGTVSVHVKPNNEKDARIATLTIAGQRFTLTQEGR